MKKINSIKGEPWRFPFYHQENGNDIQFYEVSPFIPDGPISGKVYINGKNVEINNYAGFGGPFLLHNSSLYLPLYQRSQSFFDFTGTIIAEINLLTCTFHTIGKKIKGPVYIEYLEDNILYYYNPTKEKKNLKKIDLTTGYQPLTWWEEIFHWLGISQYFK